MCIVLSMTKGELLIRARSGAVAGIVGGMALASSFMGIDANVGVPSGTFYKMIGLVTGLQGMEAIVFGFLVHMATAALIGAVFFVCSTLHSILNITSFQKGVFAGGITGLQVFAIFFVPIHLFVMMPSTDQIILNANQFGLDVDEVQSITKLLSKSDSILWAALFLHLLYGVVLGFFSGIMLPQEYKELKAKRGHL